jgi:hypothetical protein
LGGRGGFFKHVGSGSTIAEDDADIDAEVVRCGIASLDFAHVDDITGFNNRRDVVSLGAVDERRDVVSLGAVDETFASSGGGLGPATFGAHSTFAAPLTKFAGAATTTATACRWRRRGSRGGDVERRTSTTMFFGTVVVSLLDTTSIVLDTRVSTMREVTASCAETCRLGNGKCAARSGNCAVCGDRTCIACSDDCVVYDNGTRIARSDDCEVYDDGTCIACSDDCGLYDDGMEEGVGFLSETGAVRMSSEDVRMGRPVKGSYTNVDGYGDE